MEAQIARNTTHPMMIIAALSVTLLSAAGIAALMGWIPHSSSQQASAPALAEAPKASEASQVAKPVEAAKAIEVPKHTETRATPAASAKAKPGVKTEHKALVTAESKAVEHTPPLQVAAAPPVKTICYDCGVIDSVRMIEKAGEGSGLGAVAGGVAGAVLGNQVGNGNGRSIMTIIGAVGGGLAGNQIEKTVKKTKSYEITVRFEDGTTRVFNQANEPAWRVGDKIKLTDGILSSNG